jgi:hypothetical protein
LAGARAPDARRGTWLAGTHLDDHAARAEEVLGPVDREAGFERFAGWDVGRVLDRFAELRAANLDRLDELQLGSDDLARTGRHAELGPVTLEQLLATWTVHDLNHEAQIVKTLAKRYRAAVGPWRANLGVVELP